MNIQESPKTVTREGWSGNEMLTLTSIQLDSEAASELREFISSTPFLQQQKEIWSYPKDDDPFLDSDENSRPDICLVDFDPDRNQAILTAERIHERLPGTAVFAISSDSSSDHILQAMRCGCIEYLVKPVNIDHLLDAIARVGGKKSEKRALANCELLTFVGAKGGTGVTTLATHLGALLAKSCSRKALLIDLHPSLGEVALYLGITQQKYHFFDLAENVDRLDSTLLQSFLLRHPSGLDVLPAPQLREMEQRISTDAIGRTLDFVRSRYEYVLVDCAPGLSEHNTELFRRSNQLYIVTVPEVSALRNVVHYLDFLTRQEFPSDRIRVVLNRYLKKGVISDQEIEKAIHRPIHWKVPNQYSHVIRTINGGDPVSALNNSEVARSLMAWAGALGSQLEEQKNSQKKRPRGLLGLLG